MAGQATFEPDDPDDPDDPEDLEDEPEDEPDEEPDDDPTLSPDFVPDVPDLSPDEEASDFFASDPEPFDPFEEAPAGSADFWLARLSVR
jgi:hypothetical protein